MTVKILLDLDAVGDKCAQCEHVIWESVCCEVFQEHLAPSNDPDRCKECLDASHNTAQ